MIGPILGQFDYCEMETVQKYSYEETVYYCYGVVVVNNTCYSYGYSNKDSQLFSYTVYSSILGPSHTTYHTIRTHTQIVRILPGTYMIYKYIFIRIYIYIDI